MAGAGSAGQDLAAIKPLVDELGESTRHVLELIRAARMDLVPREAPLAFVHIPKTAGATVTEMFGRAWSRAAIQDAGNFVKDPERSKLKLARRPGGWEKWSRAGGRLMVGHVPYDVFRQHMPEDTRYMTFLREPVDRVLSHYHAHVRVGGLANRRRGVIVPLEEAFDRRLPELMNLATRFLCGHPSSTELPPTAAEDAKANISEFAFVGIQARFEESIALLQRRFGLGTVPYVNRHVSVGRPAAADLPAEHRALIEEHNRLDLGLYAFATELFEAAAQAEGQGLAAEVERLTAMSAAANEEAIRGARDLLDETLPPGTSAPRSQIFAAAAATGVPAAAIKYMARVLGVEPGPPGTKLWVRGEESGRDLPDSGGSE